MKESVKNEAKTTNKVKEKEKKWTKGSENEMRKNDK